MATGDHDWTAGEQVTAANMDDYLQLQVTGQYASNATRDTALSARKRENMVTAQADTNCLTVYSGAAWSTIGPVHGAWTTYAPTVTQSGAVTHTDNYARYRRLGREIQGQIYLTMTGGGTASNVITVSLPVTAASNFLVIGAGRIWDSSASISYTALAVISGTGTFVFHGTAAGAGNVQTVGSVIFTAGLASPDEMYATFCYEAAADA